MGTNPRIKSIERTTNRSWDDWLRFMDKIDAKSLDHHGIALKVYAELEETIDNPGWWAQSVTVAYEQSSGRRIPGQRPDGTFQTGVSKSTPLSMKDLMDKWVDFAAKDRDVLDLMAGDLRVGGTDNRLTWRTKAHDGSTINVISEPKSGGSASIVVQHMGLQTQELNVQAKEKWSTILDRFLEDI